MSQGFWGKLHKPITAIAPMSNVTDEPFRLMFLKYKRPDVFYTEFVSADGLLSRGKSECLKTLRYSATEHPIVAQVFSGTPESFEKVAPLIQELGFDGIDINMGCPDKDIEKKGGGAALMKNPALAKEIIRAVKRGAPDLPISIKTRLGYDKNEIASWLPAILEEGVGAIALHFRTRKQLYAMPANWSVAREVVELRDKYSPETLIIGNGDIKSFKQGMSFVKEYGLDGFMVGRGVIGNPWFFSEQEPDIQARLGIIIEHAKLFEDYYGSGPQFGAVKKHLHAYAKGFDGAKELRDRLMKAKNAIEVEELVREYIINN